MRCQFNPGNLTPLIRLSILKHHQNKSIIHYLRSLCSAPIYEFIDDMPETPAGPAPWGKIVSARGSRRLTRSDATPLYFNCSAIDDHNESINLMVCRSPPHPIPGVRLFQLEAAVDLILNINISRNGAANDWKHAPNGPVVDIIGS
jgi:hypothetical protein